MLAIMIWCHYSIAVTMAPPVIPSAIKRYDLSVNELEEQGIHAAKRNHPT